MVEVFMSPGKKKYFARPEYFRTSNHTHAKLQNAGPAYYLKCQPPSQAGKYRLTQRLFRWRGQKSLTTVEVIGWFFLISVFSHRAVIIDVPQMETAPLGGELGIVMWLHDETGGFEGFFVLIMLTLSPCLCDSPSSFLDQMHKIQNCCRIWPCIEISKWFKVCLQKDILHLM